MNATLRRRGGPDSAPLWQLRVRLAGHDHYRHMHGTEAQAAVALASFAKDLERGAPAALPSTRFAAWAADWLARSTPELANQSAASYRLQLDKHLIPAIGTKQLTRITHQDGLALQRALLQRHKPTTVHQVLRLGRYILGDAVTHAVLPANPWERLHQKQPRRAPRSVLPPDEFARLARDTNSDNPISDVIALAIATGLRRGELLGLRWGDIDLATGRLTVSRALEQVGGVIRPKAAKSDSGHRTVALPAAAVARLALQRLRATETAEALSRAIDSLPVFPAGDGHSWANPDGVSQAGRRALHAAGLADSLHGLRHAHATALLSHGINPVAVSARLGHADIATTMRLYGHVLPRDETAALAVLDEALP